MKSVVNIAAPNTVLGYFALALCLFLFTSSSYAKLEIDSDQFNLQITQNASYFEDSSNYYKAEDFLEKSLAQQFTPTRTPIFRLGYTASTLWLELEMENVLTRPVTAFLYVTLPNLALFEIYSFNHNGIALLETSGNATENVHGSVPHRSPVSKLTLVSGTNKYLIRIKTNQYLNFTLKLADPVSFYQEQFSKHLLSGLTVGALIMLCIFGIAGYVRDREPTYLAFIFYTASIGIYTASSLGYVGFYWFPLPNLSPRLETLTLLLISGSMLIFSRLLFDIPSHRKRLNVLCLAVLGLISSGAVISFAMETQTASEFGALLTLIAIPFNFYLTASRAMDGTKTARWMILPSLLMIVLGGLTAQNVFGILAFGSGTLWLLIIALMAHCLFGALAVAMRQHDARVNQEKQRQQIAIKEASRGAKTEFLAQISHEIRTPMNGILGMAELLADSPLTNSQEDYIKTINTSGSNLLKILDDILDYSKIETGNLNLDITSFDIGLALTECVESFKDVAAEKNLELATHMDRNIPFQVKGDPARVRQVLANLLSNATKFTERGSIHVHIALDTERGPNFVKVTISDTGIGINREQLLDLFGQNEDHLQQLGHHGLGLPISQRLVELMGGEMGANSQPNRGSTFWFSIPLEPDPHSQDQPLFAEQLQGMRLLIVDDNASCRLVLQQQANSWGMNISAASNGKQALAMLHNQAVIHEPFDIVILDHEMPGMSGMELAAKIKEDTIVNNDPLVLMLTGLSMAPSNSAARNAGIRRVINKPITGRLLRSTLLEELAHLRRIQADHPPIKDNIAPLPPMKVLVAEDHHLSQKVIKGMLSRLGVSATTVDDGAAAVAQIKEQDYDLILMDCEMPVMSGFDAAKEIRAWEQAESRRPVPIIALTAHIMDEHKEHSLQCGMNAHLSKPIELSELRDILLEWFSAYDNQDPPFDQRNLG